MNTEAESIRNAFKEKHHDLKIFMDGIHKWFVDHPALTSGNPAAIHSVKSRIKSESHLISKIERKNKDEEPITSTNLFTRITDLTGVRVLHLYQDQFPLIHKEILKKIIEHRDWHLVEDPKAYTWDPESIAFFEKLEIATELKESLYTSVHYVVRPRQDSPLNCEIQVRTLFEEIWGEIDHCLNYPEKTKIPACAEQLKVLSKLVGAGSRLTDSIFRSNQQQPATSAQESHTAQDHAK